MKKKMVFSSIIVLSLLVFTVRAQEINFGIISTGSLVGIEQTWKPLLKDLSKKLGMPVKPFFASDYAGVVEAMRLNKIQLAWLGARSAIDAVDEGSGEVFVQVIDKNGNPGYWALLITRQDSSVKSLQDILKRGKELSYGAADPGSTSGTTIPNYYLWVPNGIHPETHFIDYSTR